MENKLKEYKPANNLKKYIYAYWFFRNNTGEMIRFPVVPDGCSDIIFHLNNINKLRNLENIFVAGVMDFAELVKIQNRIELFGIRFKPGVLSYLLGTDMRELKNKMYNLTKINKNLSENLMIDKNADDKNIISSINLRLAELLTEDIFIDKFLVIVENVCKNPEITISELSLRSGVSIRSLERKFNKRIGISPKKFARIMKFQKAHNRISNKGLIDLVSIALSSGYFDQAHFNREYKKLVGINPNNETMSILYNAKNNKKHIL